MKHKIEPETLQIPFNEPEHSEPISYSKTEIHTPEKHKVLDDVEIEKAKGTKVITAEYALANFDDVSAEIAAITTFIRVSPRFLRTRTLSD
jgi:hypothetical protein